MQSDINEGAWDAVKNKATMAANSVKAAAGSNFADGKLRTQKVGTSLYNNFKRFSGSSTEKTNPQTLKTFLTNSTVLEPDFVDHWVAEFTHYLTLDTEARKQYVSGYDYAGDPELVVEVSPAIEYAEAPGNVDYDALALDAPQAFKSQEFKSIPAALPQTVTSHFDNSKWKAKTKDADFLDAPFNSSVDGSFIFAATHNAAKAVRTILNKASDASDTFMQLYDAGLMADLKVIQAKNTDYLGTTDQLVRDGLMTAAAYIGRNYTKMLNRHVVMSPELAMQYELCTGGGLKKFRIFSVVENQIINEASEGISDADLRGFFMAVAKSAFISGYFPVNGVAESIAEQIKAESLTTTLSGII